MTLFRDPTTTSDPAGIKALPLHRAMIYYTCNTIHLQLVAMMHWSQNWHSIHNDISSGASQASKQSIGLPCRYTVHNVLSSLQKATLHKIPKATCVS